MKVSITAVLGLTVLLIASGCGQSPRINVTPEIEGDSIVFNLASKGVNGLLGFAVMEGTNTLWEITTCYERGAKIVYGELPTGGNMAAKQKIPSSSVVPPPIWAKTITVRVDYQYDDWHPLQAHFHKVVWIPKRGTGGRRDGSQPIGLEPNRASSSGPRR